MPDSTKVFRHSHCDYLGNIFSGIKIFKRTLNRAKRDIKKAIANGSLGEFTHIAVTGVSGITMGAALAVALNKNLIVVRKYGEDCHAPTKVEGIPLEPFDYLLVDDFVSSGKSAARVYSEIKERNNQANLISIYQYYDSYENKKRSRGFREFLNEWLGLLKD